MFARLDQLPYIKKLDQLLTEVMVDALTRMFVLPRTLTVFRQEDPPVDFLDVAMLPLAIFRLQAWFWRWIDGSLTSRSFL